MASREEVLATLGSQTARFTDPRVASSFKGWTRTMQYVFPDIGLSMMVEVKDGIPGQPTEGTASAAQVTYEMSSDTFLAIARKELGGMKAFTQKLVKVKASMPDLLKLQRLDAV
jgi:putative sterol carrier protein